ncbi:hypothetical protein OPV22_006606 [Ensete ventricosum]|uniref:Uncharacterized protein n=1 Tax=Ensete ventricosum TaxID=4639 RepID=A0AAV8RFF1_ENSVE|nr:hypothetical protein OPV22_006606 [Ensete ventricosum]
MALAIFSHLQNLWPFSRSKTDDLKISAQLVRKLSVPDKTKQFVFALREPDSDAVVYILSAQNLSLQSALDAEYLIKEVQPRAVVAQISPSVLADIRSEEKCLRNDQANHVPTSSFGVLKRCLMEKINKDHYESFAGCHVLHEIFGVGFYGHFLAAKRAAEDVHSHFMILESPYEKGCTATSVENDKDGGQSFALHIQTSGLLPGKVTSAIYSSSKRICLDTALQSQAIRSVIPSLDLIISKEILSDHNSEVESGKDQPNCSFKKILANISDGQPVDTQTLSNVYFFRIAIEGVRIALNNAARLPMDREGKSTSTKLEFSELPSEEKSQVLFVQALRSQARKFGSVVAIVDAGCLAGLRRHWNTSVPLKIADLTDQCFTEYYADDLDANGEKVEDMRKTGLLADKPVVAVGAGATAALGASSLSKAIPASTFIKLATYKVPATLKFGFANLQRAATVGLGNILGSSNPLAHGLASVGAKTLPWKFTASAEKIRAVTHTMIASAERTSLLAMRTSFYEIMRRRGVRPHRFMPLATFSCSMVACTGLLAYGDGIECVAESLPNVPMIASLGRGLESLNQASKEVRKTDGSKIQEVLQTLVYNLKKMRTQ